MSAFLKSLMAELMPAGMKPRPPGRRAGGTHAPVAVEARQLPEQPPKPPQRKPFRPAPDHRLRASHL